MGEASRQIVTSLTHAAGLLSLMLWPSRKRLLKDAKKILGLTPPMRDRLARRASELRAES